MLHTQSGPGGQLQTTRVYLQVASCYDKPFQPGAGVIQGPLWDARHEEGLDEKRLWAARSANEEMAQTLLLPLLGCSCRVRGSFTGILQFRVYKYLSSESCELLIIAIPRFDTSCLRAPYSEAYNPLEVS